MMTLKLDFLTYGSVARTRDAGLTQQEADFPQPFPCTHLKRDYLRGARATGREQKVTV